MQWAQLMKAVRDILKEEYETRIRELETEIIDLELMVSELRNKTEQVELSPEMQLKLRNH